MPSSNSFAFQAALFCACFAVTFAAVFALTA